MEGKEIKMIHSNDSNFQFKAHRRVDYTKINSDNMLEFLQLFTKHAHFIVNSFEAEKEMEKFLIEE